MPVVTIKDKTYYLDGILKKNLDRVKEVIKDDWDYVYVIDGLPGTGKSVFTQQIAFYVSDGNITLNNVSFTPQQFQEDTKTNQKYHCSIFDEGFRGLASASANSNINKLLVGLLNEVRQKNLFIFIVTNSVWDLQGYITKFRMKGVFNIHTDTNKKRGFFKFYTDEQMRTWMLDHKNRYKYPSYCSFHGRFPKFYDEKDGTKKRYLIDEEGYLKKKEDVYGFQAYDDKGNGEGRRVMKAEERVAKLVKLLISDGYSLKKLGKATKTNYKVYSDLLKKHFSLELEAETGANDDVITEEKEVVV